MDFLGSLVIRLIASVSGKLIVLPENSCIAPSPKFLDRIFQPVYVASGAFNIGTRTPANSFPSTSTDGTFMTYSLLSTLRGGNTSRIPLSVSGPKS